MDDTQAESKSFTWQMPQTGDLKPLKPCLSPSHHSAVQYYSWVPNHPSYSTEHMLESNINSQQCNTRAPIIIPMVQSQCLSPIILPTVQSEI